MSQQKSKPSTPQNQPPIPENEIKQNSSVSATMALQAMQKAYELRQAANAAGDPDAREEILAKAINKEIEAESFGKAAKYTRSGAFQGLAAGAGLGVQPGVTLGKLTGALVGGLVATVTGLLGGGVGSVYGAMHGPFWDLGEMASQGVRSIVGDFPNWKSTPAQKKALEKMVMQTRETQAPTREELEKLKCDDGGPMPESWAQSARDMAGYVPGMPSMPKMSMPSMPTMPSWGGQKQAQGQPAGNLNQQQRQKQNYQAPQEAQKPKEPPKPKEAPTPKEAPSFTESKVNGAKSGTPSEANQARKRNPPSQPQHTNKPASADKPKESSTTLKNTERKKPRKLDRTASGDVKSSTQTTSQKKQPRKLERRTTEKT